MNIRAIAVILSITALSGFACEKPSPAADPDVAEQTIRDLVTQFNASLVAKDDSSLASIYASDARLLPPNEPAVVGPAAIRQYFAALWPINASLVITSKSVKIARAGDMAVEEGTWTMTIPNPAGAINDNGKYLVTWVNRDGSWKVYQDTWNSSNPPQPTAPPGAAAIDSVVHD